MGLAHEQMKFGRALADLDQAVQGLLLEGIPLGLVGGDSQNIEVIHLQRGLGPEGLQRVSRVGIALYKKVTEPEEVPGLVGIGIVAENRLKRREGRAEIILAIVDEADVEPDAGNLGRKFFGLAELVQGGDPLLAAHGDDSEVGVGSGYPWVDCEHLAEIFFGESEVSFLQGSFCGCEQLLWVGHGGFRSAGGGTGLRASMVWRSRYYEGGERQSERYS